MCPRHLRPEQPGAGGTRAVDALCSTPRLLDSTLYPLPSGHPRSPSFLGANHAGRGSHQWPQAPPSSPSPQQKDPTEEVRVNTLPLGYPFPACCSPTPRLSKTGMGDLSLGNPALQTNSNPASQAGHRYHHPAGTKSPHLGQHSRICVPADGRPQPLQQRALEGTAAQGSSPLWESPGKWPWHPGRTQL